MERIKEIFNLIKTNVENRRDFYERFVNGDYTPQMSQLKTLKEEAESIYSTLSEEKQREVCGKFEYIQNTYMRAWNR